MPYVAGGSLRERLRRGEGWALDAVLHLVRDVATALEHAHRQGIIHRDVKPENVLFFEGEPMVADFGIARAITSAGGDQLTRSGFPVGTPGYMSPEQAMGGSLVDARTDVFGLGCVVYELLVGETPPIWPTDEALRVGRFLNAPEAHRARLERLPGRVAHLRRGAHRGSRGHGRGARSAGAGDSGGAGDDRAGHGAGGWTHVVAVGAGRGDAVDRDPCPIRGAPSDRHHRAGRRSHADPRRGATRRRRWRRRPWREASRRPLRWRWGSFG